MNKVQLSEEDKARLSELINEYSPRHSAFKIKADGRVITRGGNSLLGWIIGYESEDFLSIFLSIIDKIGEKKAEIEYASYLASEAFGLVVTVNNRSEAIKKLYTAHLIESDPADFIARKRSGKIAKQDIEIKLEKAPDGRRKVYISPDLNNSIHIADLLNNNPHIVIERY